MRFLRAFVALLLSLTFAVSCSSGKKEKLWSEKMAESEIKRHPESWMLDFARKPKWGYCQGLETYAIYQVYKVNGDKDYFNFVRSYGDTMILEDGKIRTYDLKRYNIDNIAGGKTLLVLYDETGEEKYKIAADTLVKQMQSHPRTADGGFWHKLVYPHQMWLDGLFMGSPFLAMYASKYNKPELFDEAAHQIILVAKHTHDPKTGLYYHGWDESRKQKWANKKTGTSPNFWSRSIGWYIMAMVDVLEYLPENHPRRQEIIKILQDLSIALEKYRDPETGVWYQVTDQVGREKNYLESSGTCMFMYAWIKGANNGWLDSSYKEKANQLFDDVLKAFVKTNEDGTISITNGCCVSGLGGNPYRDGSYEYYTSEPYRDNDPKSVSPFILAALQLKR